METVKTRSEALVLFHNLDKPSLHALSYALRHPDTWPQGFVWNYGQCNQCAMGLARALWKHQIPQGFNDDGASIMAREFAMPYTAAECIFLGNGDNSWIPTSIEEHGRLWWKKETHMTDFGRVTPDMVADQIDKYLETAE